MIDVRSDTVTRPDAAMRKAMAAAEVGDDVYGDDASVNALQAYAAELLRQEASLFMPSGTQSNLVALLTHCQRGDEYIVGADAHTYKYEGGGAAALGGIQPQPMAIDQNGGLDLATVASLIKEDDVHFAKTRLLCLENSQHGRVQSLQSMRSARQMTQQHGLQLHLDGARMANAAVALEVEIGDIGECFDSVSLCLSKGLGAPIGSLLAGSQSFIDKAKRWRKVTGGGMRQAGIVAAAGMLALQQNVSRLNEDHENAARLAMALADCPGFSVRHEWTQTNMVWLDLDRDVGQALKSHALEQGVLLSARGLSCRLVTHLDVSPDDVDIVVSVIRGFFSSAVGKR